MSDCRQDSHGQPDNPGEHDGQESDLRAQRATVSYRFHARITPPEGLPELEGEYVFHPAHVLLPKRIVQTQTLQKPLAVSIPQHREPILIAEHHR